MTPYFQILDYLYSNTDLKYWSCRKLKIWHLHILHSPLILIHLIFWTLEMQGFQQKEKNILLPSTIEKAKQFHRIFYMKNSALHLLSHSRTPKVRNTNYWGAHKLAKYDSLLQQNKKVNPATGRISPV